MKKKSAILQDLHARFTYTSDIAKHSKREHWESLAQYGEICGDCEDFALTLREALIKEGYRAELATVGLNSNRVNHCVVICDNRVLDNIHMWPVRRSDLPTYKFIAMTKNGIWREVL